jgi:glycosyltransferase involved in cell wall biosynthesis
MNGPLVSIGLPVRNAEHHVAAVVTSALGQDYANLEVVISDNASTDATEDVCRELARADARVKYHRQPANVGIMRNFITAMNTARGDYFRWIGHDDSLAPSYVTRTLGVLAEDRRLLLVTTQIAYELDDGSLVTSPYDRLLMSSEDPAVRFEELVRIYTDGFAMIDPLYALMDRRSVAAIPRRNMLREDEVFAANLALRGPWGHIPEVLATRRWSHDRGAAITNKLDVPRWHAYVSSELQVWELARIVREADLSEEQRRRARAALVGLYVTRHKRRLERAVRKLARLTSSAAPSRG